MDVQEGTDHDEIITQFIAITGAEEECARHMLEACEWNLEMAINMHVDANPLASTSAAVPTNPEPTVSRSETAAESDEIRPPIPPVRQVLVEDYPGVSYNFRRNASYDAFRNFEQETRWQEQQMLDEQGPSNESARKTFEDLFRPPLDLIFRGSFEMAKFEGQQQNKWLMVNIQNPQEFACQVLNRDVWSNHAVKSIISEHFIFWQSYHNNGEGQKYVNFYDVTSFPYVSIVDPRTGEKMISWNEVDTMTFCDNITQFLTEHPSPGGKIKTPKEVDKTLYDENEDLQIKAAIQASLMDIEDKSDNPNDADDSDENLNDSSNPPPASLNSNVSKEDWKNYLGPEESPKVEIILRYPDGNRENAIFPSTSLMKALFLYVRDKGYQMEEYDLITNFPKKNLSSFDEATTLESAGIHSRDTLYVQMKH